MSLQTPLSPRLLEMWTKWQRTLSYSYSVVRCFFNVNVRNEGRLNNSMQEKEKHQPLKFKRCEWIINNVWHREEATSLLFVLQKCSRLKVPKVPNYVGFHCKSTRLSCSTANRLHLWNLQRHKFNGLSWVNVILGPFYMNILHVTIHLLDLFFSFCDVKLHFIERGVNDRSFHENQSQNTFLTQSVV